MRLIIVALLLGLSFPAHSDVGADLLLHVSGERVDTATLTIVQSDIANTMAFVNIPFVVESVMGGNAAIISTRQSTTVIGFLTNTKPTEITLAVSKNSGASDSHFNLARMPSGIRITIAEPNPPKHRFLGKFENNKVVQVVPHFRSIKALFPKGATIVSQSTEGKNSVPSQKNW